MKRESPEEDCESWGATLGDVVYYFTERKEDQSLTESAEKGRGNAVEATREEAPVSGLDIGQMKGPRNKDQGSRNKEESKLQVNPLRLTTRDRSKRLGKKEGCKKS